jgi:hypothetical protein
MIDLDYKPEDSDYWSTPYNAPEKWGLKIIGSLGDPNACYSFDDLIVWRHDSGVIFWATDSGCSCPSPFEDVKSLRDLTLLEAKDWDIFSEAVKQHCTPYNYVEKKDGTGYETVYDYEGDPQAADKTQLLQKVSALL